jgi:iron complex transport system substrate-binding protein
MRLLWIILILWSCGKSSKEKTENTQPYKASSFNIEYAEGFQIEKIKEGYVLKVTEPWPQAEKTYRYLLKPKDQKLKADLDYDYIINTPVENIVVTSTTHIPSLDTLNVLDQLIGFPNTDYVSTKNARKLIKDGQIRDVGQNQSLNTELLIELNPEAIVTFAVKGQNKGVESLKKAGIPVLYNADWVESHPLGKAEWIKFFGLLFDKTEEANQIFEGIKNEYQKAKTLVAKTKTKPEVLSGALWKDQWYLPAGDSWQAKIINDANANYLYADKEGTGSLSLSFESVLSKAQNASFWIAPAQYTSYQEMLDQQPHYSKFNAFKNQNIYSFSSVKGANGGVLYYEVAPNRPDLVLKDIINILHPEVLKNYKNHFFKPLNP